MDFPPGDDQRDTVIPWPHRDLEVAKDLLLLVPRFLLTMFEVLCRNAGIATANPIYELCYDLTPYLSYPEPSERKRHRSSGVTTGLAYASLDFFVRP